MDPLTRYREYLRSFGIAEAGARVAELRDLDLRDVRFFAYAGSEGLRLKAAATRHGLVAPGGRADDDWHGFLSAMPDAMTAAERLAWLETDAAQPPHGLPGAPALALAPEHRPSVGLDPAQWDSVTAPALVVEHDGRVTLTAWLLPSSSRIPSRWTVTAQAGAPAFIERAAASDLLEASVGGAAAAVLEAGLRARRLLATGNDDERWWALQHIGDTDDREAIPALAALLINMGASPNIRLLAAGTLARFADPVVVIPLGDALRADPATEVRRACAQALGRLPAANAVQALVAAAPHEPDVLVRAEIVQALAAQGRAAHAALAQIARDEADPGVRNLARHNLNALN